jgi:hypothetical protein
MAKRPRIEHVNPRSLKLNEEFAPKPDPIFKHLLIEAVKGRLPVYFAVIEFDHLRRFDVTHRPELTFSGKQYVEQIAELWEDGQIWPMWVYPSGGHFIASDDYFTVAAYEREQFEVAPCYVLGKPEADGVSDIRGPLTIEQIKQVLGFS